MNSQELIYAVSSSVANAELCSSKLTDEILTLDGMSGKKNRHFLNNLLARAGVRYLEIGTWKGSTLISALYKNSPEFVVAIDNFSQFSGPEQEFKDNCTKYLGSVPRFINGDCFSIKPVEHNIDNINVYFYDGEHSQNSQRMALDDYHGCLSNEFIFIVDDWNWDSVRSGTNEGLNNTGAEILYKKEIFTKIVGDKEEWWNGLGIFVLRKKS